MNGRLSLRTISDGGKTVAEDIFFTPPFKLYSPFYENGCAKFISMSATAGVLAGDCNEITLHIGNNSNVKFTDQSYQKIFNTKGGISRQNTKITVGENGKLVFLPHPIMTFAGSRHKAINTVDLTKSSTLCFSEIYCCGRTAMGEAFALEEFSSRTQIRVEGQTDFIDNTLIIPAHFPVTKKGFFEGYTHTGIMYVYSPSAEIYDRLSKYTETDFNDLEIGCSVTEKGFSIRVLGMSGDDIFRCFENLAQLI